MSQLLEQLLNAITELKSHPLILVEQETVEAPAASDMIDRMELLSNTLLPQDVKEFYLAANGLTCTWRLRPGLDEEALRTVRGNGEQLDFDYSGILGSIHLLPIQTSIFDQYWKPPTTPADAEAKIEFGGKTMSMAELGKRTKLMDAYEPVNDAEAMAFLTEPFSGSWRVVMLDDYLADWRNSRLTEFSTYIRVMAATHFTIPSRKRIFGKYRGDQEPLLLWEDLNKEELVPSLFR